MIGERSVRRAVPADFDAALLVQLAFLLLGTLVLAVMAVEAHTRAYFPGDVPASHAVQTYSSGYLDAVLGGVSWFGFPPQSDVLFGAVAVVLFVVGARWAAVMQMLAAAGSGGLYLLLEHVVRQPRPSADLVRVTGPIQMTGFPSGHMATFVAVFGFLAFLGFRRLAPRVIRWVPIAVVTVVLLVLAIARIYSGHHWASDVLAGALLGGLWLAVVIRVYGWGVERRVFSRSHDPP